MRIPIIRGTIDRRILVNFRVDPDVLRPILPPPFRVQLVGGFGVAGICLIRLKSIRPKMLPAFVGIGSENAAHRIAVEWDEAGETKCGVYIPRRDTSSLLNTLAGGRLFPGVHRRAKFDVRETAKEFHVDMRSLDGSAHVLVEGTVTDHLPADSVFASVDEASKFFAAGSLGYSPQRSAMALDGLELRAFRWQVEPLDVTRVESSFFEDREKFPAGSVTFDNALLMRGIEHEWHGRETLCCVAP